MGQISAKLRGGKTSLTYWCQGCDEPHSVRINERGTNEGGAWGYDGNAKAPTFTPSVLVTSGHFMSGFRPGVDHCWCDYKRENPGEQSFDCHRCHTFIRGGMVEFLTDCTHALAGQTLPLPDLPEHLRDEG